VSKDVYATALGGALADPKDISPRVKSSFFFTRGCAGFWDIQSDGSTKCT